MAVMELTYEQFNTEIRDGKKMAIIDYWAPWCVHCRRIASAYDKIAQEYGDKLLVAKVNIDDVEELARQEMIEVIPTLVFYKDGRGVDSIVAPESKAKIAEFIEEHLDN